MLALTLLIGCKPADLDPFDKPDIPDVPDPTGTTPEDTGLAPGDTGTHVRMDGTWEGDCAFTIDYTSYEYPYSWNGHLVVDLTEDDDGRITGSGVLEVISSYAKYSYYNYGTDIVLQGTRDGDALTLTFDGKKKPRQLEGTIDPRSGIIRGELNGGSCTLLPT